MLRTDSGRGVCPFLFLGKLYRLQYSEVIVSMYFLNIIRKSSFKMVGLVVMICVVVLLLPSTMTPISKVLADDPCVIVIDPGHGGENLGADHNGYIEKEINMIVAQAMYEELLKYENVEVYLTHTDDVDMSLKERARFAASKDADFFFCLHFNMSVNHNLFGTEVWISAFDKYYAEGMSFGKIQIETMEELGLYSRGVKTKLMESREADYYGIIRESRAVGVTCALIEHCHLDHMNDEGYYESDEKLQELGRADATAAAKYLGLRSELLDVDYSDYPREEIEIPNFVMKPDYTNPDVCYIEELSCDTSTGEIQYALTAQDYDSPMLYYSYSLNNGRTWSEHFAWEKGKDTLEVTIQIPSGREMPTVKFRAHNLYDRFTESNAITYPTFHYGEKVDSVDAESNNQSEETLLDENGNIVPADSDNVQITFEKKKEAEKEMSKDVPFLVFLEICLIVAGIVFFAAVIARIVKEVKRAKRRKQRRNQNKK